MANNTLIFLVIVSLFSQSFQDTNDNKIEIDPYKEAAKEVNKKYDAQTIGDTMKTLFENGGSDLLSSFVSEYGSQKDNSIFSGIKKMVGQKGGAPSILNTVGSVLNFIQAAKGGPRKGGEEDLTGTIIQGINEFKGFLDKNQESGGSIVNAAMAMLSQAGQQDGKSSGLTQILESLANVGDQGGQGQGAAALLSGMGSLLALTQQGRGEGEGGAALLEGLGALLGQGQTGENGQADALVQGLGALFGQGKNGENGKNEDLANLFGSVVNMLGQNEGSAKTADKKEAKSNDPKTDPDFNMNDLLTLAGSFMDQSGEKGGENNILSLLPSLLQTMNSFIGPEAESRAKSHEGHSSLMPPMLEKFHILFDHFLHSEAGQKVIEALGAEKSFKVFMDDKGRFSYKKFGEMMENLSYRKQWISIATDRIAEYVKHLSQPQVYKSYMLGAQIYLSTYLRGQGFPKATIFDPAKPVETISACINYIAKKYFDTKINSKEYVKPAVQYIKDTVKLAEKSGTLKSLGNSDELSNKLADTLNLEIIEPLVRVNRAYRFAKSTPKCERYVLCLVNEASQNDKENLPDLKKLLSKGSSLLAGWLLSANSGTPFWTLYTDITENTNCKKLYSTECDGFHAEELKVTTEYVHNEL